MHEAAAQEGGRHLEAGPGDDGARQVGHAHRLAERAAPGYLPAVEWSTAEVPWFAWPSTPGEGDW